MTLITPRYITSTEPMAGRGGSFTDTLNRALRDIITNSGLNPDVALSGQLANVPAGGRTTATLTDYIANNKVFNVWDFAPVGIIINTGVADASTAIQGAYDAAKVAGGIVDIPEGQYKIPAGTDLNLTTSTSTQYAVIFRGRGRRATQINGQTTGRPVFDCTGASFLSFMDLTVGGNSSFMPTTAWLLARNSTGNSAGQHEFINVETTGNFSVAAVYDYASEENHFFGCNFVNFENGKTVVTVTQKNVFALASNHVAISTGVISTTSISFHGCGLYNYSASGNADALYLEGVSSFLYQGGFMITSAGRSCVYIDASTASSANVALRDIMWDGGNTQYGVTVAGPTAVVHLAMEGIYDTGVLAFAGTVTAPTGGITLYGQDGSVLQGLTVRNVYSTAAHFFRVDQLLYSELKLGASDRLYIKGAASGNDIAVDSTLLTLGTPASVNGTKAFFLNTGTLANPRPITNSGDASVTLTATSTPTVRFDTTLTANRTVTLPSNATSAVGQRFRIVRTGLGAFTLTVQDATPTTLKAMPSATAAWCEVEFDGSAWKLAAYGTL